MPRTRLDIDREDKVAEIVAAAKRQTLEGGFAGLSMAGVARELGVAQNAVYWYFPSRDHLFVAVVRELVADVAAGKPPSTPSVSDRAVWLVDRVAEVHPLLVAMRERAREAEVVADFQREIDLLVRDIVTGALADHVPRAELAVAIESFLATIEGALLRQVSPTVRASVVTYTLALLTGRPWQHSGRRASQKPGGSAR